MPNAPTSPLAASEPMVASNNQTTATAMPVVTKSVVLPQPAALLEYLKSRVKGSKATLEDMEIVLELITEMSIPLYGDRARP